MYCPDCGRDNRDSAKFCIACGCSIGSQTPGLTAIAVTLCPGMVLQARYEIKKLLKSGGMGSVYLAADLRLGIYCAVKDLRHVYQDPRELQEARDRFEREARTLAKLQHPRLPGARDHFEEKGSFYFVMDYVEGEDLEAIQKREAPNGFPEERVKKIACEVLEILEYLHTLNPPVVYRDLKPSNIMIRRQDKAVVLIDFGIARAVHSNATKKTAIGTEGYAPPEQYRGNPEPRSDLYALGATMHHLLTGVEPTVPFHFDPTRIRRPDVSVQMETVVSKALEMDPEKRFSSAQEMRETLKRKATSVPSVKAGKRKAFTTAVPPKPVAEPAQPSVAEKTLKGLTSAVLSVSFSPNGKKLASGSRDGTVIIWDVAGGSAEKTFMGHTDGVSSVSFSPDGKRLASGSDDKTVIIWDVEAVRTLGSPSDNIGPS
ncbi:MAG: protein kinase [Armatimonadetes bacterium]|nr:protein kinase [Armatimonadota bacterium]